MMNENEYIGYEYLEVMVKKEVESLYIDSNVNFGWELEKISTNMTKSNTTRLKFKRNRKLMNKVEITRLERLFLGYITEIEQLEKAKTMKAATIAYILGLLGTALMACSTFSYLNGNLPFCILLAIPAFIGWIIPYPIYCLIKKRKIAQLTPLINEQYDHIDNTCQKANALLNH